MRKMRASFSSVLGRISSQFPSFSHSMESSLLKDKYISRIELFEMPRHRLNHQIRFLTSKASERESGINKADVENEKDFCRLSAEVDSTSHPTDDCNSDEDENEDEDEKRPECGEVNSNIMKSTLPGRASVVGGKRIRQHVNPLTRRFQIPVVLADTWVNDNFQHVEMRPFHIDIGCGKGVWLLQTAEDDPSVNYLGLEIRDKLVEFAEQEKTRLNLNNLHYIACNANVDINRILTQIQQAGGIIASASIQFPDPHFKTKQKKRRVLTPEFIQNIYSCTVPGFKLFVQSDIDKTIEDMVTTIVEHGGFSPAAGNVFACHPQNTSPMKFRTEREAYVMMRQLPIYRMLFIRNSDNREQS